MPKILRICILILVYLFLILMGQYGIDWLWSGVTADIQNLITTHETHLIATGLVFYIILMAIPFVPGLEISLALFSMFGVKVIFAIYTSTIIALTLSFLIGRLIPIKVIARLFKYFGLLRASNLIESLQSLNSEQRLNKIIEHVPKKICPFLLRNRYLAIMIAFNIPGNLIIGGGGGIALIAGISGLFRFPRYMLAILIAVSPVPLFVIFFGA